MPDRLTSARINLSNYRHNLQELIKLVPDETKLMAVVKANAYGHGLEEMARTAIDTGASYLGVVSLGEAKRLRSSGVSEPIMILNYIDTESIQEALSLDITLTVMDSEIIEAVQHEAAIRSTPAKVHLKVDTGMHRAGCNISQARRLAEKITHSPNIEFEGLFTHLAESENPDESFTRHQLDLFDTLIEEMRTAKLLPPLVHAANGAAVIAHPSSHYTMVRPGLATYGLNPLPKDHPKYEFVQRHFVPVLSLHTSIAHVRTIETGESVGYGRRWTADRASRIALLPIGYGDGLRRTPHADGSVLIKGMHAPIVGAISMDQTTIDVTDVPDVDVGDEVIVLGQQGDAHIDAEKLAMRYQTISYEVMTSLSERIVRQYIS